MLTPSQCHTDQIWPLDGVQARNIFPVSLHDRDNPVPSFYSISKTASELARHRGEVLHDKIPPGPKEWELHAGEGVLNSAPKLRLLQTSSGLRGQLAAAVLLESSCYLLRIRGDILAPGFCKHARSTQPTPFELQPSISAGGPPHCRCFPHLLSI